MRRALVPQVVGPDQGGVAGHVAAGEPAPLQHRDVGDAVVLGQVVRGRQAVAAAADDDHVVGPLRLRVAPEEVGVLGQVGPGRGRSTVDRHQRGASFSIG